MRPTARDRATARLAVELVEWIEPKTADSQQAIAAAGAARTLLVRRCFAQDADRPLAEPERDQCVTLLLEDCLANIVMLRDDEALFPLTVHSVPAQVKRHDSEIIAEVHGLLDMLALARGEYGQYCDRNAIMARLAELGREIYAKRGFGGMRKLRKSAAHRKSKFDGEPVPIERLDQAWADIGEYTSEEQRR